MGILEKIQSQIIEILDTTASPNHIAHTIELDSIQTLRTEQLVGATPPSNLSEDGKINWHISQLLAKFIDGGKQIATTQRILESLWFKQLSEREQNVKNSHASTYRWIFGDSDFMKWLEKGSNVYWIAGKAGSGKSTFMKLICNEIITSSSLRVWAGQQPIIIARHFFWSGGNLLQKSQNGLLRSLLYQILQQCPALMETVCPTRWQADKTVNTISTGWSDEELFATLVHISISEHPVKICVFVDGLDEYRGDHKDIISKFQKVGSSKIKFCLSSRPWNVFQNAFSKSTPENRMMLQDYTKNDIIHYVSDTLRSDDQFQSLAKRDKHAQDLIRQIAEKANGVFLWVFLVVRSLLLGLTDDNSITELQQRVNDLPEDLNDFFNLILINIEPFYRMQTAQIFLTSIHVSQPQSILFYSFLEHVALDPNYVLGDIEPLSFSQSDLQSLYEKQRKSLNARCKDLLEITIVPDDYAFLKFKVDFLHRTVKDFLSTSDVHDRFKMKAGAGFEVRKTVCRAHLAQIKASVLLFKETPKKLVPLLKEFLNDAYEIESYHDEAEIACLDELNRVMLKALKDSAWFRQNEWTDYIAQRGKAGIDDDSHRTPTSLLSTAVEALVDATRPRTATSFLSTAVEARLHRYVIHKLKEHPALLFRKRELPLLCLALERSDWAKDWFPDVDSYFDIEMTRLLFQRGANPNQRTCSGRGFTVWDTFLWGNGFAGNQKKTFIDPGSYDKYKKQVYEIAEMFIEHGADVDLKSEAQADSLGNCRKPHLGPGQLLQGVLEPEDWARLEKLMEEKRNDIFRKWSRWFRRDRPQRTT